MISETWVSRYRSFSWRSIPRRSKLSSSASVALWLSNFSYVLYAGGFVDKERLFLFRQVALSWSKPPETVPTYSG